MEIRFVKSISWKDQNVGLNDSFSYFFEFDFAVYILTTMLFRSWKKNFCWKIFKKLGIKFFYDRGHTKCFFREVSETMWASNEVVFP